MQRPLLGPEGPWSRSSSISGSSFSNRSRCLGCSISMKRWLCRGKGFCITAVSTLLLVLPLLLLLQQSNFVMPSTPAPASSASAAAAAASLAARAATLHPMVAPLLLDEAEAAVRGDIEGRMTRLRGFVVVEIKGLGLLLMERQLNPKKPKKGKPAVYMQLPGGHGDWNDFLELDKHPSPEDFDALKSMHAGKTVAFLGTPLQLDRVLEKTEAAMRERVREQLRQEKSKHSEMREKELLQLQLLLQQWGRITAARELYEETGIDFRDHLEVLIPLPPIYRKTKSAYFFLLQLEPEAAKAAAANALATAASSGGDRYVASGPLDGSDPPSVLLRIDKREHSGFDLEADIERAALDVQPHAAGMSTEALLELLEFMGNA